MTEIRYEGVPAAVRREVAPILKKYRPAFPRWLNTLIVEWTRGSPEMDGTIATMDVKDEYRHGVLHIYADRWSLCHDFERILMHELSHCHVAPIEKIAHSLLEAIGDAGANGTTNPLHVAMLEQVRRAMETTVEDVCMAIVRARNAA